MIDSNRYKVAVIGSGAVTELFHLPALTKLPSVDINAIVDRNEERAKAIASKFCLNRFFTNYEEIYDFTDVALVALPNHLHARVTIDFLEHDVNVLCEKPMATSVSDCNKMIAACKKSKAKLMIGHNKRFMSNVILAKKMIDLGNLGKITGYSCKVGGKFRWPTQTGFYFKKNEAGGGVLIDLGVHIIDMLLWFFGETDRLHYQARDIMQKGVEDNVFISFQHKNAIKGEFRLSRTEVLENTLLISGTLGWIKINLFDTTFFELHSKKAKATREVGQLHIKTRNNDTYRDQVEHFLDCIKSGAEPLISGVEGMKAVKVVEECYRQIPV